MIRELPRVIAAPPERPELAGPDHPVRKVTREIAFEPGAWTPERAGKVAALFDGLAPEWHTRATETRLDVLRDALERGNVGAGLCIEVGSGTGFGTPLLAARFERVVALDLSLQMLVRAPAEPGYRVRADAAVLPLRDGAANAIILVNAFLFPAEIDRALARDGTLVWVSSLGDRTPIYLSARDVERALPGTWQGVTAEAGWGTWSVLRRGDVPAPRA